MFYCQQHSTGTMNFHTLAGTTPVTLQVSTVDTRAGVRGRERKEGKRMGYRTLAAVEMCSPVPLPFVGGSSKESGAS